MTIENILANIELSESTFRNIILSTNYSKIGDSQISWGNYKPGIFKCLYAKEYEQIIRDKQYSFLLADNLGCIQFFYDFDNEVIKKIKLCYYPYPVELREKSDEVEGYFEDSNDEIIGEYYYDLYNLFSHQFELSLTDDNIKNLIKEAKESGNFETEESLILANFESKYAYTNSSHLRIDYDSNVTSHHKCEIQVGAINNIRIPLQRVIMPFTFCDFIFKNIVKSEYESVIAKSTFNSKFNNSKRSSKEITPFTERNIFLNHL